MVERHAATTALPPNTKRPMPHENGSMQNAVHTLFGDLGALTRENGDAFEALFHNRHRELASLQETLIGIRRSQHNILVTGLAGVGKSTFVHRILRDKHFLDAQRLFPVILDYREGMESELLLLDAVEGIDDYFNALNLPCAGIETNTAANIKGNLRTLARHLRKLEGSGVLSTQLIVFLDDFDYMEEELFEVLNALLVFAGRPSCTMILSARPGLFHSVNRYDDRVAQYITRNVHHFRVEPLEPFGLIAQRLAILISESEQLSWIAQIKRRFKAKDGFQLWLNSMGLDDAALNQLGSLEIPFNQRFLDFMSRATSGNIRDMLQIAERGFDFVLTHKGTIDDVVEETAAGPMARKNLSQAHIIEGLR